MASSPAVQNDAVEKPTRWVDIVRQQPSPENATNAPRTEHKLDTDLVVACQNKKERDAAETWLAARGYARKATLVTFNVEGASTLVLVHSKGGPRPVKAQVRAPERGPKLRALPSQLKDDVKPEDSVNKPTVALMRLTLARNFADTQLTGQAVAKPHCLPALVLEAARGKILQIRAATAYPNKVTCLIQVKADHVQDILALPLPVGVFCNVHKSDNAGCTAISLNVTVLTKDRLTTVLDHAKDSSARIILLQETKHHSELVPWAARLAKSYGWNIAFSKPPTLDNRGARSTGGTAILWHRSLGKGMIVRPSDFPNLAHRSIWLTLPSLAVGSAYGPVHRADRDWFNNAIALGCSLDKPSSCLIVDFNWKPPYSAYIPPDWRIAQHQATTVSGSAPTRAVASCGVQQLAQHALPDIPYHLATHFRLECAMDNSLVASRMHRSKRCATYKWTSDKPDPAHLDSLFCKLNSCLPGLPQTASIDSR